VEGWISPEGIPFRGFRDLVACDLDFSRLRLLRVGWPSAALAAVRRVRGTPVHLPSTRRCAGSWPFPRALSDLPRLTTGSLRFHLSTLVCRTCRSSRRRSCLDLSLGDITTWCVPTLIELARADVPKLVVRVRLAPCRISSLGVVQRTPLRRHPRHASTPGQPQDPSRPRSEESGCSRPCLMAALRHELAKARARSALAVSHGFDGFLRVSRCRFVAPCSRPWGSPGFELLRTGVLLQIHLVRVSVSPPHPSMVRRTSCEVPLRLAEAFCRSGPRAEAHSGAQPFPAVHLGRREVPGPEAVPTGVLPFEVFPSPTAAPRHRGPCPLVVGLAGALARPLPALLARGSFHPSTSRRCSIVESVARSPRCRFDGPDTSLGFMVRQVLDPAGLPRCRAAALHPKVRRASPWTLPLRDVPRSRRLRRWLKPVLARRARRGLLGVRLVETSLPLQLRTIPRSRPQHARALFPQVGVALSVVPASGHARSEERACRDVLADIHFPPEGGPRCRHPPLQRAADLLRAEVLPPELASAS
jgi:hypothetical protein